ncbi:MAG TPA: GTPase [Planctomycetaceae bacterium]|nr:GTPase [Planctomycetaceae bacterium]
MDFSLTDTIAALASAPGGAARGIVRISGSGTLAAVRARFHTAEEFETSAPRLYTGQWELVGLNRSLPADVYLWPTGRSYTGQPAAEVHTLGSPPLLDLLLEELIACGVRPARPGEFTLRAFLAGRVDLMQAEAVLGVIDAEGQDELRRALDQLAGGTSLAFERVRSDLLDLLADLEAGLDFSDEGIEFVSRAQLLGRVQSAAEELRQIGGHRAARARSDARPQVVLAGAPNVGKSTLFNRLAGREVALVSDERGTTRDYLRAAVEWDGIALELIDTAGWEQTSDPILQQALVNREGRLSQADLILWCASAADMAGPLDHAIRDRVLHVRTKADLAATSDVDSPAIPVSAHAGTGVAALRQAIVDRLSRDATGDGRLLGMTAARCRDSLEGAISALERAAHAVSDELGEEFLAIDVRDALEELGKVTGAVYTDDILDRVFSKFCIGK